MTKNKALEMFGSSAKMADALGVTRSTVSNWPENLPRRLCNEIIGAALQTKGLAVTRAYFPEYFK